MPRRGGPADAAAQHSVAQVKFPLVVMYIAVANVKRLVVDQQADEFAVGDIDNCLSGLGVGVSSLCIGQRAQFVERIQVGAWQAVRLPLIEVASQSDMSVGEGENGLGLRQGVEMESHLADAPLLDCEGWLCGHDRSPCSVISETMIPAPCGYTGRGKRRADIPGGASPAPTLTL